MEYDSLKPIDVTKLDWGQPGPGALVDKEEKTLSKKRLKEIQDYYLQMIPAGCLGIVVTNLAYQKGVIYTLEVRKEALDIQVERNSMKNKYIFSFLTGKAKKNNTSIDIQTIVKILNQIYRDMKNKKVECFKITEK